MLYNYIRGFLEPFRRARAQWFRAKSIPQSIKGDAKRMKGMAQRGKGEIARAKKGVGGAKDKLGKAKQKAAAARQKAGGMGKKAGAMGQKVAAGGAGVQNRAGQVQGAVGGAVAGQRAGGGAGGGQPRPGGPPGAGGGAGAMQQGMPPGMGGAAPGGVRGRIKRCGFLWLKRKCVECMNKMEKGWDACPYCNAAEPEVAPAPAPAGPLKTQAFMINEAGTGNANMALLGWLVPVRGPQRGELFTLASESLVGTEPSCTVVLQDSFMSSRHCEIKAEGGQWVLKDLGSTNGTFVNDKRVDRHELVDNDFVKVGQCLLKFKCL